MAGNHIVKALHTGISVYHMEEALAWYEKNLGFVLVKNDGFVPPLHAKVAFIENRGYQIELFEYEQPKLLPADRLEPDSDLQTVGTKHLALLVDDMAAMKAQLLANGVDIAHEVTMGSESVLFIRDCSGVLIELIQH